MDPVAVSTGSACSSGAVEPSAALLAMGLSREAAFEDYLAGTDGPRRREWAKVQGRFEDVAYSLDAVYDYFVAGGASAVGYSQRWSEIATRLRDAQGLTKSQMRLAKSIAILNLVSTGGAARASAQVLDIALNGAATALTSLQDAGIVTYRDFADEFRIWHGTDVDIRGLIKAARTKVQRQPLVDILAAVHEPDPVVRHPARVCPPLRWRHRAGRSAGPVFALRWGGFANRRAQCRANARAGWRERQTRGHGHPGRSRSPQRCGPRARRDCRGTRPR